MKRNWIWMGLAWGLLGAACSNRGPKQPEIAVVSTLDPASMPDLLPRSSLKPDTDRIQRIEFGAKIPVRVSLREHTGKSVADLTPAIARAAAYAWYLCPVLHSKRVELELAYRNLEFAEPSVPFATGSGEQCFWKVLTKEMKQKTRSLGSEPREVALSWEPR